MARTAATEDFDVDKALASAKTGTFDGVANNYLDRHVRARGLRSEPEIVRILDRYVRPRWGGRRFADIGRRDVADLLDDIQDKHGATVADSVLAIIRGLMNWFQSRDDNYVTPIVRGMNRGAPPRRSRWLNDDEIKEFWFACESSGTYGAILRVLLLTGHRRAKVNEIKWSDINLATGEWNIARAEREKGTPSVITLPKMAMEIIASRLRIAENDFVFAGRGSVAFNSWSESKSAIDKILSFTDWRTHDLRRTCRKLMTRAGVATEIAELALGHSIKGIQGVYDDPDCPSSNVLGQPAV
jgi:integrase